MEVNCNVCWHSLIKDCPLTPGLSAVILGDLQAQLFGPFLTSLRAAMKEDLELQASKCSSTNMFEALRRLSLTACRNRAVPCCLAPNESLMPAALRKFK